MTTQIYCTKDDIEAVWTAAELLEAVDDNANSTFDLSELATITRAIERAANRMNAYLEVRYSLASLANNLWCRDANAMIAAYILSTRRGDAAPDQIQAQYTQFLADLVQIAAGTLRVPQVEELLQRSPTVTNFVVHPAEANAKVRRVDETSTGSLPPGNLRSHRDD